MTETMKEELRPYWPCAVKWLMTIGIPILVAVYCYCNFSQQNRSELACLVFAGVIGSVVLVVTASILLATSLDDFEGTVIRTEWDPFSQSWQICVDCYQDRRWVDKEFAEACRPEDDDAYVLRYERPLPCHRIDGVSEPFVEDHSNGRSLRTISISGDIGELLQKNDVVMYDHDVFFGRRILVLGRLREPAR